MRSSRPPGPPSTMSGSSGHGLVYGTHRPRGSQYAFTPEGSDTEPTKKKTKLIVILGIALPVLACIIGMAAWAVTTDVLRITPRANDNSYNRFGHQGKTRIDNMQSRSDTDIDVFVLHGITPPTSASPTVVTKSVKKENATSTTSTTGATVTTGQTVTSPKASDILSRLISDMPPPKYPKNFVVFAPVADTENTQNQRKGRRFDGKLVQDGDDLVAEESVVAEDTSQELDPHKLPFSRKQNPSENIHSLKNGMRIPDRKKMNQKGKLNRNGHIIPPDSMQESPPNFIKRPTRGDDQFVPPFSTNLKPPLNAISNRNGGATQSRPNGIFQQRTNFQNSNQNKNGYKHLEMKAVGPEQQQFQNLRQNYKNGQSQSPNQNFPPSPFQQSAQSPSFKFQDRSTQFQLPSLQNKESLPIPHQKFHLDENEQSNQPFKDNQRPLQNQHNIGSAHNQHNIGSTHNQHNIGSTHNQNNMVPTNNQHNMGSNPNQHNIGSPHNQQMSFQGTSQSNFPNMPQNSYSSDNTPMGSGGPEYFAPPPQTFHTKINYDHPAPNFPSPPSGVSTYEKAAQNAVESAQDGTHHHHHHHHHHEPVPSNSDPIGDVNYSDVPRPNDADRLGSIGIGMGPSRGITVQIGGGGGGGGLSGLLPLGTLGIAKNIVSALLPRPQLGLNSKVFLGVEVGKGGGFQIG